MNSSQSRLTNGGYGFIGYRRQVGTATVVAVASVLAGGGDADDVWFALTDLWDAGVITDGEYLRGTAYLGKDW